MGRTLLIGLLVESVRKLLRTLGAPATTRLEECQSSGDPLIIVAPPRTGSTALHRLLALHRAFVWTRLWETAYAPPVEGTLDLRAVRLADGIASIRRLSPRLLELHPVSVDEPEECIGLLESSLLSPSFVYHAAPEGYLAWLDTLPEGPWDDAYRIYGNQLRELALGSSGAAPASGGSLATGGHRRGRWLLKSGEHLHGLSALLRALPRARVLQIHRSAPDCVLSFCRLLEAHHRLYSKNVDPRSVGLLAKEHIERGLARAVAARCAAAQGRFFDVDFVSIHEEPVEVVRRVLAWLDEPLPADAERRLEASVSNVPSPKKLVSCSSESLGAYGLDADVARAVFADYDALIPRAIQCS